MAITIHSITNVDGDATKHYDLCGMSTDSKPSSVGGNPVEVNSLFWELDTGDFYYLQSPATTQWVELIAEQTISNDEDDDPVS